jgi:hypothetical protein
MQPTIGLKSELGMPQRDLRFCHLSQLAGSYELMDGSFSPAIISYHRQFHCMELSDGSVRNFGEDLRRATG